jgi:hypothetical protein|tara:strand:+ start:418 stop:570 length:153 start_codon:yes stop_codon:yes gene_type:complete
MRIKDFFNISKNKANNQDVLTLKKRFLKKTGLSKYDLLNLELNKNFLRGR